jgi:hypothetical protein
VVIADADLHALDDAVNRALRTRDPGGLHLLGWGEVSLVVGWPSDAPAVACKRLPPFRSRTHFDTYADSVRAYITALHEGGVGVLDTDIRCVERHDGTTIGYHAQPLVPTDELGTEVLRSSDPDPAHPLLGAIADAVARVTTDRLGVDAQLSNWVWRDGHALQLDLTTPIMLDAGLLPTFELDPFLRSIPAMVRPMMHREMRKFMNRYLTPRTCFVDFVSNLPKEGLASWVPAALDAVNARVETPITESEAAEYHAQDVKLWPLVLRLQRAEAWWQRAVRRRTYEFLLREHSTYAVS